MLKIYNTFTNQKEEFRPIDPKSIGIYVCGMTVYDFCHMGHARVLVMFDVITRHMKRNFPDVNYVRNITDIDDKIISRAIENNEDIYALTNRFIDAMHEDEKALGVLTPDLEPRATDSIDQMINMIESLTKKGLAYQGKNGDVYYSVRKFKNYGRLSGKNLDDLVAGARIDIESDKQDPLDFVLWKMAKPNEPKWPSPWGEGRPGWHIECSAMSTHFIENHFDIHGGGMDLTFPHHENEIAQSEGANNCKFVNTWMHVGFVNINDEKMSKSLDNFFTIRDVLEKYDGETVRYEPAAHAYAVFPPPLPAFLLSGPGTSYAGTRKRCRCLSIRASRPAVAICSESRGAAIRWPCFMPSSRQEPTSSSSVISITSCAGFSPSTMQLLSASWLNSMDYPLRLPGPTSSVAPRKKRYPSRWLPAVPATSFSWNVPASTGVHTCSLPIMRTTMPRQYSSTSCVVRPD